MRVVSRCQYPITVPYAPEDHLPRNQVQRIQPGRNEVDDDVWEKIKPRLEGRLDRRDLRVVKDSSDDLTRREARRLVAGADKTEIEELCAKSKPVDSGQVEGAGKHDREFKTLDQLRSEGAL